MQAIASEFSQIFRGYYPGPSQREGATTSRTQHPARPLVESTTNQAERHSNAAHFLARWEHLSTTARWSRAQVRGPSVIPTAGIHYKLRRLLT